MAQEEKDKGKEEKAKEPVASVATPTERPTACAKCAKKLRSKSWYYRDNKYYCSKRCWKTAKTQKPKEPQQQT